MTLLFLYEWDEGWGYGFKTPLGAYVHWDPPERLSSNLNLKVNAIQKKNQLTRNMRGNYKSNRKLLEDGIFMDQSCNLHDIVYDSEEASNEKKDIWLISRINHFNYHVIFVYHGEIFTLRNVGGIVSFNLIWIWYIIIKWPQSRTEFLHRACLTNSAPLPTSAEGRQFNSMSSCYMLTNFMLYIN